MVEKERATRPGRLYIKMRSNGSRDVRDRDDLTRLKFRVDLTSQQFTYIKLII